MKIKCTISTPQFKDGKINEMKTQSGEFDYGNYIFTTQEFDGHDVHFHSIKDFDKYRVDKKVTDNWLDKLFNL